LIKIKKITYKEKYNFSTSEKTVEVKVKKQISEITEFEFEATEFDKEINALMELCDD
jgi:hypothetical protein